MKTILYNTVTQKLGKIFPNGYYVGKEKGDLSGTDFIELEILESTYPTFDPATERVVDNGEVIDLQAGTYKPHDWQVVALTQQEIDEREAQQYKAGLDWLGLESDLQTVQLVDSPGMTFFTKLYSDLSDTPKSNKSFSVLMSCFYTNNIDFLDVSLQDAKDSLQTPLTANELNQLNGFLQSRGFTKIIIT